MNASPSFPTVDRPCDDTLHWLSRRLRRLGLRVMQTFDLQDVRPSLEDCSCPHHGTEDCDCQMVVVLVYGKAAQPATLMLHGHDGQTWISLVDRPDQAADPALVAEIRTALVLPASS